MLLCWTGSVARRAQAALLLELQETVWFAAAACMYIALQQHQNGLRM
jgi:hypothetical protein